MDMNEPCTLDEDNKYQELSDLLDVCPGLLIVRSGTNPVAWHECIADDIDCAICTAPSLEGVVQLAHASVKDYLTTARLHLVRDDHFSLDIASANHEVASVCLGYMISAAASDRFEISLDIREDFPLLVYAARFWFVHARRCHADSRTVNNLAYTMLSSSRTALTTWLKIWDPSEPWQADRKWISRPGYLGHPLFYAALLGLPNLVETVLTKDEGSDLNVVRDWTAKLSATQSYRLVRTPLQAAAHEGHLDIMKMLVQAGARVDFAPEHSDTPLCLAANGGHLSCVKFLVEHGCQVNAVGFQDSHILKRGGSALEQACLAMHHDVVRFLSEHGARLDHPDDDDNDQNTFLLHRLAQSSRNCNQEILELILELGAGRTTKDERGRTPFLHAARFTNSVSVLELLSYDGAFRDCDSSGATALHLAGKQRRYWVHVERPRQYEDIIRFLLKGGAEVDARDERGRTPLHYAIEQDNECAILTLLAAGCNPRLPDYEGLQPLHMISLWTREDATVLQIVAKLLESGASINAITSNKETALHIATHSGNAVVIQAFVLHGADVNLKDKRRVSALDHLEKRKAGASAFEKFNANREILLPRCGAADAVGGIAVHLAEPRDQSVRHGINSTILTIPYLQQAPPTQSASEPSGTNNLRQLFDLLLLRSAVRKQLWPDMADIVTYCMASQQNTENISNCILEALSGKAVYLLAIPLCMKKCQNFLSAVDTHNILVAASQGDLDTLQILHKGGVDLHSASYLKLSALIQAVRHGHTAIVHYLLSLGAPVNHADGFGRTALHFAAANGSLAICRELISRRRFIDQDKRR